MPGKFKVTVVGAGNVGGTTAQKLAEKNYADVVLVAVKEGCRRAKRSTSSSPAPSWARARTSSGE